jgi:hypothetical protein
MYEFVVTVCISATLDIRTALWLTADIQAKHWIIIENVPFHHDTVLTMYVLYLPEYKMGICSIFTCVKDGNFFSYLI